MQADNNPTEKIHKKDDHLCDSDRYFHTFLPDLTPPQLGVEMAKEPPADMHGGKTKVYGGIDEVLAAMKKSEDNRVSTPTQWNTHESSDLTGLEYD
jgi:hypothetical protein